MLCKCGCGESLEGRVGPDAFRRAVTGKANAGWLPGHRHLADRNPRWNGGVVITVGGYRQVKANGHPNGKKNGYILEHRLVMATHLGRALLPTEVVHHINGDKLDNRIENLVVMTNVDHKKFAHADITTRKPRAPKTCVRCGAVFTLENSSNHKRNKFCSVECSKAPGEHHPRRIYSLDTMRQIALRHDLTRQEAADVFGVPLHVVKKSRRMFPQS